MLLFQQSLNVIIETTVITSNVIDKTITNDTLLQYHFLNAALNVKFSVEESVKKVDGLDSFCN